MSQLESPPLAKNAKQSAAFAALDDLRGVQYLGIGTGSTVNYLIDALGPYRHQFEAVVSSSRASSDRLRQQGIQVTDPNHVSGLDLYIDGADECDKHGQLIKGGGGALTGEKILAKMAKRFVCIVDDSKYAATLGAFPVPVEVIAMARSAVARQLVQMGGQPVWRDGFISDHGHLILDVAGLNLTDPKHMEQVINNIPGVVSCGIFALRGADVLCIADAKLQVQRLEIQVI